MIYDLKKLRTNEQTSKLINHLILPNPLCCRVVTIRIDDPTSLHHKYPTYGACHQPYPAHSPSPSSASIVQPTLSPPQAHTRPAPPAYPGEAGRPRHGDVAGEARLQRHGRRQHRLRRQPPRRLLGRGCRRRPWQGGAGGRVRRGAACVRAGGDAGGRRGDGRGPADEDHRGDHRRRAAAAAGARHRQVVLLFRLRVLRGGERDGVRLLGAGAGSVPEARRHGGRDGGGPGGAGAALLGGGGSSGVRHPRGARQLARALGQGVQRLQPILRTRHDRRHRLPARRIRQPRPPHAHHPRHPQELLLLLVAVVGKETEKQSTNKVVVTKKRR